MSDDLQEQQDLNSLFFCGKSPLICGCGKPELVVGWALKVLEMYAEDSDHLGDYKKLDALFPGEMGELARWCFMYWMDGQELNEHGTGLSSGGWLTPKGVRTLELLRKHGTDPMKWADS